MNHSEGSETYAFRFDKHAKDHARRKRANSARAVFDILFQYHKPKSIIDVGCGIGGFLAEAHSRGMKIKGVDGPWWNDAELDFPQKYHETHDLNEPYSTKQRFGVASTIEVAEHLAPERSQGFVDDLCGLSDYVLFSAAIPGQKGNGHINNRWQGEWAEMFAVNGYRCYDPFRRRLFAVEDVQPWYRCNLLFYVRHGAYVSKALAEHEIAPSAASYKLAQDHDRAVSFFRNRIRAIKQDAPVG